MNTKKKMVRIKEICKETIDGFNRLDSTIDEVHLAKAIIKIIDAKGD